MASPEDLGLGCSGLGNHRVALSDAAAHDLLQAAWDAGVRLFDTAPHYGLGLSERRLGDFLRDKPRASFRVSTKVGRMLVPQPNPEGLHDDEGFLVPADARRVWDFSPAGIRASLESSLQRLGLDRVDTVYLHDPERHQLAPSLTTGFLALTELKEQGLADRIGVASMTVSALLAALRTGSPDEIMVAGRHTLIDRTAMESLLPLCAQRAIRVVAAAVFNGELLAGELTAASTFDYAPADTATMHAAQRLRAVADAAGVSMNAAALQFPLRHPSVSAVVAGAVHPDQVRDNARAIQAPLPECLWAEFDEVLAVAG